MKKYRFYIPLLVVFSTVLILSCDSIESGSTEFVNPEITYHASGTWSIPKSLKISSDKKAVLLSSYPNLELRLSDKEYASLIDEFKSFSFVTNDPKVLCFDATVFTISISENGATEEKTFDGCYLGTESTAKPKVKKILQTIVASMEQLADSIYQEKAPWIGLESDFYSEKETYVEGENIELSFKISNPTTEKRTIYFEQEEQINFDLDNHKFESQENYFTYYYIPRSEYNREIVTEIELDPGETKMINFIWDQVTDEETGAMLQPGNYTFNMYFITPYLNSSRIDLEIVSK